MTPGTLGILIAGTIREPMHTSNVRRTEPVSRRIYFLLAFLMIVIAFAHVLAFDKLNAARSTPDRFDIPTE
jgi:hypothetical protein